MESFVDESSNDSESRCSSDELCGKRIMDPRVGDVYQAQIPPLIKRAADSEWNFLHQLSTVPVMWAMCETASRIQEAENKDEPKVKGASSYKRTIVLGLPCLSNRKVIQIQAERSLCPLPGSLGEPWTDLERQSLLLGLFIFGRNFSLVQRFVESKKMEDVLSFYYGGFYKSAEYCRWSESRKSRKKRGIHGTKIFSGWRQQELLSRLLYCVPEERKSMLLEVTKSFGEQKDVFQKYIFALKSIVGVKMLIDVVCIGNGKKDLTTTTMEPARTKCINSAPSERQRGRTYTSLANADIVKLLTGGMRLSKARSNDLFWDAVWPRLLARGWHSEQAEDHGASCLRNSLVFLIPGVNKFSRRKLVKDHHYFESVTDVLRKVALDPSLFELDIEADKDNKGKEGKVGHHPVKRVPNGISSNKSSCYLHPFDKNKAGGEAMFTVVDTGALGEPDLGEVIKLRSLQFCFSGSELSTYEEKQDDKTEETGTSKATDHVTDIAACTNSSNRVNKRIKEMNENQEVKTKIHRSSQMLDSDSHYIRAFSGTGQSSCNTDASCDLNIQTSHPQNLSTTTFSGKVDSTEIKQPQSCANLNVPQVSPEVETIEPVAVYTVQTISTIESGQEEQPNRRKSTRNRPPTTKALEAIAFGPYGSPAKKRKDLEVPKPSRRARGRPRRSSVDSQGGGMSGLE